jgi:hypothetical protein
VHSWKSPWELAHSKLKPLEGLQDCPPRDTLRHLVPLPGRSTNIAVSSSGTLVRFFQDKKRVTKRTNLDIIHALAVENRNTLVLIARESKDNKSFLQLWETSVDDLGSRHQLFKLGKLKYIDEDDDIVSAALLPRRGHVRNKIIIAVTASGRILLTHYR